MILGPILDHIFGAKKINLFCPVFVFRRGMSNAICDLVLYLQSECLNISWIYPGTIPFQYLKMVFAMQYSTLSLTGSQSIFLKWLFHPLLHPQLYIVFCCGYQIESDLIENETAQQCVTMRQSWLQCGIKVFDKIFVL